MFPKKKNMYERGQEMAARINPPALTIQIGSKSPEGEGMPPNLREAEDDAYCGMCDHYGARLCSKHDYPVTASKLCDDFTDGSVPEEMPEEEAEVDEQA